jgi:hypothetical protein
MNKRKPHSLGFLVLFLVVSGSLEGFKNNKMRVVNKTEFSYCLTCMKLKYISQQAIATRFIEVRKNL